MQELDIPFWKHAPFLRALIPFLLGIIIADLLTISKSTAVALMIGVVILLLNLRFLPLHLQFRWQQLQGILFHLFFFFWGVGLIAWQDQRSIKSWYGNTTTPIAWKLQLLSPPEQKNNTIQVMAAVMGVFQKNKQCSGTTGKIKLMLEKDSNSQLLSDGDIILIGVQPTAVKYSENPGSFNYRIYLQRQQIYEQVYVPSTKWQRIYRHDGTGFFHRIHLWQQHIRSTLNQYLGKDPQVLGIAEALLIGYKGDLDAALVQSYSSTGVVHIIAISGLHLGLIYWVLNFLLGSIPFFKKHRWLKAAVIITALWIFSLLTGASASVLRSAVMFTLIVVGEAGERKSSIIQSLAASAFLLLLYNPFLLWDVGFQLSYLAIIGIISLQKPIEQLFSFRYKAVQYVWQMCSVTLAAQVMTTPIAIYYFHQFPHYFLAANLLSVPLSTIILFAELLLLLFSSWPLLAHPFARLVELMIQWLNAIIVNIHHWPFAISDYLPADVVSTCLFYTGILCLMASLKYRHPKLLLTAATCSLFFISIQWLGFIQSVQQKSIIVLQVRQSTALLVVNGRRCDFWGDTSLVTDATLFNRYLRPALLTYRLTAADLHFSKKPIVTTQFQLGSHHLLAVHQHFNRQQWHSSVTPSWILLSSCTRFSIDELPVESNKTGIIFDNSIPMWKIEEWKKQCDQLHLRCISIQESGAWVLNNIR